MIANLTLQYHDNGDPGFTEKGRDLNRFRCELSAYRNLSLYGVCEKGHVPQYYGYIDRLDPTQFRPYLDCFNDDLYAPEAIVLEYFPNVETLNCVNYSKQRYQKAVDGIEEIHKALVHHRDVYPKNLLLVLEDPERVLWVDFDVATTYSSKETMGLKREQYNFHEVELVKGFGELLVRLFPLTLSSPFPNIYFALLELP